MKIYKKCATEPSSFLVDDTLLSSDNPLNFKHLGKSLTENLTLGDEIKMK